MTIGDSLTGEQRPLHTWPVTVERGAPLFPRPDWWSPARLGALDIEDHLCLVGRRGIAERDVRIRLFVYAVAVFVVYETAFADADGKLQYRADSYRRDAEIWQFLNPR